MEQIVIDYQILVELIEKVDKIYSFIEHAQKHSAPKEDEPWLDNCEVCNILHISEKTLYRLRKKKLIPYFMMGNSQRYLASNIYKAIKNKIIKCDAKFAADFYQNYINDAQ